MRVLALGTLLLALGAGAVVSEEERAPAPAKPGRPAPRDLRTRKTGVDWPCFLGPTGDSVSPEKGIRVPWPRNGPRIVWHKKTGIGYSMPVVSRGRLFLFDRVKDRCRLRCWKSETGEHLWVFDYPTDYRDKYNYNGGPRCSPVVDGDRVYIFGPEGMLHCGRAGSGKLGWNVDTR